MKAAVLVIALLAATAVGVWAVEAEAEAESGAEVDAASEVEFNTHDADALELEDSTEMELETDTTTEAELVDTDTDTDAAEDEAEDAEEAADELEAESESEQELANEDEMDSETREAAAAENEAVAEHSQIAYSEVDVAAMTRAQMDATAKCSPVEPTCPDGSKAFAGGFARTPDYNGCGPDGNKILNDATLGGRFSPCCNNHDLCYGRPTAKKDTCDVQFHNCMKDVCGSGVLCKAKAYVYYKAVSIGGCSAWTNSRLKKGCKTGAFLKTNKQYNSTTSATPAQTDAAAAKFFKL